MFICYTYCVQIEPPFFITNISKSMASLTTMPTTALLNVLPPSSSSVKPLRLPVDGIRNNYRYKVSCKATNNDQNRPKTRETPVSKLDRRDVLLGLGGLYGASKLTPNPSTMAAPIVTDPLLCRDADIPEGVNLETCCPPYQEVIDFTPPTPSVMRVRPAAQWATPEYVQKYEEATALMKALPQDDPRNFLQQAYIHCAYCSNAYEQVGFPNLRIDVHNSWLFYPFHRWYLYFYEKILGKLIDDPTFTLPFWNWDSPSGMTLPAIYLNPNSSLYDPLRDQRHLPPAIVELDYSGIESGIVGNQLIKNNLCIMYRQMVAGSRIPRLFYGAPYRAGDPQDPGMGAVETIPHNTVHVWTGDPTQPNREDMGAFYSAARDPIFYAHHSNLDRMWALWRTLPGGRRRDYTDSDWLDTSFIFYDENAQLVRVKVRDSLDTRMLGYVYDDVYIPWLTSRPTPRKKSKNEGAENADYPITLDHVVRVMVKRPKKSRSKEEKLKEEEVLVIDGIRFNESGFVKMDVYINEDHEEESEPDKTEFAGSFAFVPEVWQEGMEVRTVLKLGITELLEDLAAEDYDKLMVTLVRRAGPELMSVDDIRIEYEC